MRRHMINSEKPDLTVTEITPMLINIEKPDLTVTEIMPMLNLVLPGFIVYFIMFWLKGYWPCCEKT